MPVLRKLKHKAVVEGFFCVMALYLLFITVPNCMHTDPSNGY